MARRFFDGLNRWSGTLALFLVLTGGTAMAVDGSLPGQNTVGSADIINAEVKAPDIGQGEVLTDEIANGQVQSADVKNDALTNDDIAQDTLGFRETATSASDEIRVGSIDEWDVADNSLGFLETPTSASDEIKFGSIDHFDVANGSLRREDFEAGVLPEARFNGNFTNSLSNNFEEITSRFVPEGSWVAFANLRTYDGPNGYPRPEVHCELRDPGGVMGWGIDSIPDNWDDDGPDGDFDNLGRVRDLHHPGWQPGSTGGGHIISVWCKTDQGPGTQVDAQLMLIRVGRFE